MRSRKWKITVEIIEEDAMLAVLARGGAVSQFIEGSHRTREDTLHSLAKYFVHSVEHALEEIEKDGARQANGF